ncbi:MAG: hypothetical protein ABR958_05100 [Dehalococcoidales bacterium]
MAESLVTEKDIRLIIKHLEPVKRAGWGEVLISVSDYAIVYLKHSEGEKVKIKQ